MAQMERCPACRARLGGVPVCSRCGTDFSICRQAERQSLALAAASVRQLFSGQIQQANATAEAASQLASSLLARAVLRTIRRREIGLDAVE